MREFPSTELHNDCGGILDAADREPVAITRYRRPKYVIMSAEQYDKLIHRGETRRSFAAADMPEDVATALDTALAEALKGE